MTSTENAFHRARVEDAVAYGVDGPGNGPGEGTLPPRPERDTAADLIDHLFRLCRRHDLPFGVVVVGLRDEVSSREPARDGAQPTVRLWQLVAAEIRRTDLLASGGPGCAIVFCPVTPPQGLKELMERLRVGAGDLPIAVGSASFQDGALTVGDLVSRAALRGAEDGGTQLQDAMLPPKRPGVRRDRRVSRVAKRLFDLFAVGVTAPLWIPLLAAVALAVKLSDPRAPVLFVQERTGRGGRRFRMFKFRTMVPDAEERKAELRRRSERSWPDFKIERDPRVTRLGRHLRTTSLDELPQLWNVLRGDMSLVGPRPTSFEPGTYEAWQTARLEATPGLTGLWQIEARNCADFSERIRLDLRYVDNQSFLFDLKILLRTVPAVLWDREGS